MKHNFTAVIQPESLSTGETVYVAHCPEIDVASQGESRDQAAANLREAIELLFEAGGQAEIERRLRAGTQVEALEIEAFRMAA